MNTIPESPAEGQLKSEPSWLRSTVSIVANAHATATTDTTIADVLSNIKNGKYRTVVESIRATYNKALKESRDPRRASKSLKNKLPGIMWSGEFTTRKETVPLEKKLVKHSGILCADLDDIPADRLAEVRQKLKASPSAGAIILSPTGSGLKFCF